VEVGRVLLQLLRRYLRPYWSLLAGVVVFQTLQTLASLYLPTLNADIIDRGVVTGDTRYVLVTGLWMLLVTLGQVAATVVAVYYGARTAMGFGRDVRAAVFGRVAALSEREVGRFGAASLITRTTNDVQQVQMLVLMGATLLVTSPITAVGGVALALHQDVGMAWVLVVAVPVLLGAVGAIVVRMVPQFRLMQVRLDGVNRVLREQLTGVRVVRAFVREPVEEARFAAASTDLTQTALKAGRLMALMFPTVMLVMNASTVAVVWLGAHRIADGDLQVGQLTAFISYLVQILMAVMMTTMLAFLLPRAAVSADRIGEVLEAEPSVVPPADSEAVHEADLDPALRGTVELRGATFAYPGAEEPVLHDISFTAAPGTTTAVVGSTGGGKTTLVNLLPRLFDATGGAVLVDGVDVRRLDPDVLWDRIGLVPQRALLFAGTVASNLRFGRPDATDAELWEALETAQAADFVRAMPGQLEEPVTQGGTSVSGGQRQRLAIARALVKRPAVYVFDDAFSALDTATDARLRAALDRAEGVRDATRVVVAQRVATVVSADQILVLEHGRVVARGTHAELLETSPEYQEIVTSQLSATDAAVDAQGVVA
jgi:ATP-binding cassette, subfamily B, multidrug efflux pump